MSQIFIDADNKTYLPNLKEIYDYRQLLLSLAWRDIKVKYAQTLIGITWAFVNPILSMLVLVFVFNKVAGLSTEGIPALVFTSAGLIVWNYFSVLFSEAGNSIVGAQNMVKKIYFPRLVIPLSKAISGLVDLVVTIICLFALMLYFNTPVSINFIFAPVFILIAILCGVTGGIWMSALSVRYRDFKFIIPFITRLGMFLSPVAYSIDSIPEKYHFLYFLNPITGAIEGFRWSVFGVGDINSLVFVSIGLLIIIFILGLIFFTNIERTIADII